MKRRLTDIRRHLNMGLMLTLMLLSASTVFAQIDPIVAKVRLTKVEVITKLQFKKQVEELEAQLRRPFSLEQRKQLLNSLVDNKLLLQAAERANTRVTDMELNQMLENYKQELGARAGLNRKLTDSELEQLLRQEGLTWEKLKEKLSERILLEKFVTREKKAFFDQIKHPTETEIRDFYDANRTQYPIVSPEMVRFKQILILTKGLNASEEERARARAMEIFRKLQAGDSFDKYLEVYLQEGGSKKIGGLSFDTWRRNDSQNRVAYGASFFERIFKLEEGERSDVMKSNVGYHIVEIIEKIPFRVLSLDDKIPPKENLTVREYIKRRLLQNRQLMALKQATEDLVESLKREADVQYFYEHLSW